MPRGSRGGTSLGSGVRCVAANCGNTSVNGVSLHKFPKDPSIRRIWTKFVDLKRVWKGPTPYSALCAQHFTEDCFPFEYRFKKEHMDRTSVPNCRLNKDAVPTIHSTPLDQHPSPIEDIAKSPPKKKKRLGAFKKRELARIVDENTPKTEEKRGNCDEQTEMELQTDYQVEDTVNPCLVSTSCQANIQPKKASKQCQTRRKGTEREKTIVKMVDHAVQTDPVKIVNIPPMKDAFQLVRPAYFDNTRVEPDDCEPYKPFLSPMKDDLNDPTYKPPMSPLSDADEHLSDSGELENLPLPEDKINPDLDSKFIIFKRNLMELFDQCRKCATRTQGEIEYINGSMVKVKQKCNMCNYAFFWQSQPFVGNKPAGNLLISAGILFSGSIPSKALRFLTFMKVAAISSSTYMNHQKHYLYPSIEHVWKKYQVDYVKDITKSRRSITVGGDGRSDTPGHSAKFGSYTMLDLDEGVVVDVQLVQSNEVKGSSHMEKEGLARSVKFFKDQDIPISSIVTDRHVQIVKWVRENMLDTKHCFDVWHVAKGLKKKLLGISKEKDCDELRSWIRSLVNHMYWTAATSADENSDVTIAKWVSVLNHVTNVHSGHSPLFNTCQHGELEGRERFKKWLKPSTKVFEKLDEIIKSRQMRRDIPMLSSHHQTSALEGYHSVINHFAPKIIGFSYHGMLCRLWLAALHFNENSNRKQAYTADGKARYRVVFPKFKKGEYTIRKVQVE